MKVLWVPHAQLGSLLPAMPYVQELVRQGHSVSVLATDALLEMRHALPPGVTVVSRQHEGDRNARLRQERPVSLELLMERVRKETSDTYRALAQVQPDVMFADPLVPGASMAAERVGLPWVSYVTYMVDESAGYDPNFALYWRDERLPPIRDYEMSWGLARSAAGVSPRPVPGSDLTWWSVSPYCTLLMTHPLFRHNAKPLPEAVHLANPVPWAPPSGRNLTDVLSGLRPDRPTVLVTSSTTWQNDIDLARTTDAAGRLLGVNVVSTIASEHDTSDLSHPIGMFPHTEIIPAVDAVVGVGGMGVTTKAVYYRKPQIVSPRQRDTPHVARVIDHRNLGLLVSSRPSVDEMVRALEKVLANRSDFDEAFDVMESTARRRMVEPRYAPALFEEAMKMEPRLGRSAAPRSRTLAQRP